MNSSTPPIRIFLSYAGEDEKAAEEVANAVKERKFELYDYRKHPAVGQNQELQIKKLLYDCHTYHLYLQRGLIRYQRARQPISF